MTPDELDPDVALFESAVAFAVPPPSELDDAGVAVELPLPPDGPELEPDVDVAFELEARESVR